MKYFPGNCIFPHHLCGFSETDFTIEYERMKSNEVMKVYLKFEDLKFPKPEGFIYIIYSWGGGLHISFYLIYPARVSDEHLLLTLVHV